MFNKFNFLFLLAVVVSVSSCSTEDDENPYGTFEFDLDGVHYSYPVSPIGELTYYTSSDEASVNLYFANSASFPVTYVQLLDSHLPLTQGCLATDTFYGKASTAIITPPDTGRSIMAFSIGTTGSILSSMEQNGMAIVTSCDPVNHKISGVFSCILKEIFASDTTTHYVTNGVFTDVVFQEM